MDMMIRKKLKSSAATLISFFQDKSNLALLVLLVASYFIFFFRLGEGGIRQWDESSLAVNTLEMLLNGNLIVKYMGGEIDLINTKPPLAIWSIVGFMKVFGYSELALRLPSAICATATVIAIYAFARYYLKDLLAGFIGGLVLLTSIGFTGEHVARTGDYDAMLVLWITCYSLAYFIYLNSKQRSQQTLFLAFAAAALILAVWTKGIAGALALPGLFVYSLYKRKLKFLLTSWRFHTALLAVLILSLSYYVIREAYGAGYLKAVVENELTGRYMDVVPGGTERGFTYYFVNMMAYRFVPWFYFLPVCWLAAYYSETERKKDFSIFGLTYLSFYFFIISYSKSKFNWYDAPLYPIAALTIGIGLSTLIVGFLTYSFYQVNSLENQRQVRKLKGSAISLVLCSIFFLPYFNNFYYEVLKGGIPYRESDKAITDLAVAYRDYFSEIESIDFGTEIQSIKVINRYRYNLPLLFYTRAAQLNKRHPLEVNWKDEASVNLLQNKDVAINCDPATEQNLQEQYVAKVLHRSGSCQVLLIEAKRT